MFVLVGVGYFAGYELASNWFSAENQGASFFPSAGVTLGALVLLERRRWPIVLAAAALTELSLDLANGTSAVAALGYMLANTAEPLTGALLLTGAVQVVDIRRTRHLAAFISGAVVLAPVVGGVIAATTFVFVDGNSGWARFAFEWWSGDGLGVLVVGGALLSVRFVRSLRPQQLLEWTVLGAVAVGVTAAVFEGGWFEFTYVPVALLVVLAFRVGTPAVALTSALVAFVAAGATAEAKDFWASIDVSPANRVLYLQLAMAVIVGSLLGLAAEISERERIAGDLAQVESERRAAVERAALVDSERAARTRTERLQALTTSLSAAASVSEVAGAVAVQGVAMLEGDAGLVAVPVEGGRFEVVAAQGWPDEVLGQWSPFPADIDSPVTRAAAQRDLVLVESVAQAVAEHHYESFSDYGYPSDLPDRAGAAAPMIGTAGTLLGVVYIAFHRERRFDSGDRRMLQALVSQGAQALERALSFDAEQTARRQADESAARIAILYDAAGRLAASAGEHDVGEVLVAEVLQAFPAVYVVAGLVRSTAAEIEVVAATGRPQALLPQWRQQVLDTGPAPLTLEGGPVWSESPDDESVPAEVRAALQGAGRQACAHIPLHREDGVGWTLVVDIPAARPFTPAERELLVGLGQQASLALERAAAFEGEQAARRRAELLETHAAQLAAATSMKQIARVTIAQLKGIGVSGGWIQVVKGGQLEMVEALGVPEEDLEPDARESLERATPQGDAVRTGEVVALDTGAEVARRYPDSAVERTRFGFESLTAVPLTSSWGRVLAVLTAVWAQPRSIDGERRQLLMALSEQCGLALERAELQAEAEAVARDTAFLVALGEALELATDTEERARALVEALVEERAAVAVVYSLDQHQRPRPLAAAPQSTEMVPEDAMTAVAAEAVSSRGPATAVADDLELLAVPLRARGRILGALTVGVPVGAVGISPGLGQRIATRAALALDNALLYEQERNVSHALQLGLLGGEPEGLPDAAIATAYRPGSVALEVGGDWYDAFTLPDGRLALVVGDVVGHGLDAAVAMGQLRGAVRALAPVGPPREVLERLDDFVDTLPEANMATLAFAKLDLDDGILTYACAGHPPPLLLPAGRKARLLWEGRSVPLGSSARADRVEAEDRLHPGDTLLLYTDGLVERRTSGISAGLERLLGAAANRHDIHPADLVRGVLDTMLGSEAHEDDVCLLAVRRTAPGRRFVHSFPASPAEIAGLRGALAAWLERVGVDGQRRYDVVLAASEAAANAAEHAYGFDGAGVVYVEADLADGEMRLSVRDEGTWRVSGSDPLRGRGRTIMEALMREVTIESSQTGTVVSMRLPVPEVVSG